MDVLAFLTKHGGASRVEEAAFTAFEFQAEDKKLSRFDESVPTVLLGQRLFACGDTGGLRAEGNRRGSGASTWAKYPGSAENSQGNTFYPRKHMVLRILSGLPTFRSLGRPKHPS